MTNYEKCEFYLKYINDTLRDIIIYKNIGNQNMENYKIKKFEKLKNLYYENYNQLTGKLKHEIFIKSYECYMYTKVNNLPKAIFLKELNSEVIKNRKWF